MDLSIVLEGLLGLGFGLAACLWTGMTALVLVDLIACWAIVTGQLELTLAIRLRRVIPGELLLELAGGVSLLLGIVMLLRPEGSAVILVILLGGYALFLGAMMLALAFRLRRWGDHFESAGPTHLRSHYGSA
jgi:uncharacterized membrane protein HdeD (DUF308 family)